MKIQESITTFDKWISPSRVASANKEYPTSTQAEQLRVLGDAAEGNTVAADLLFDLLKKIIAKAFWKYYMGPDKAFHQQKISGGADKDFASMAYEMLLGGGDPSPYDTFKPSKFSSTTDLLKQFGYYFYRYLQNESFKLLRAEKIGGITGNIKQTENPISTVGYESHFENDEDTASVDSYTNEIEMKETIRAFLKKLKTTKPLYHDVFLAKLRGASIDEVGKQLGISGQSVRNHLKAIKVLFDDFTGGSI